MALTLLTPKGFCTSDDVAAFLGVTFTPLQLPFVNSTIARVERFIEQECNRSFSMPPQIDEANCAPYGLNPPSFFTSYIAGWVPLGADLYCKYTPIQTVNQVRGRGWLDSGDVVLVPNLDYEVRDLELGLVRIVTPSAYYRIAFDYVPANACPMDISQAVIFQVATWLLPMLNPETWSLDSYQLPDLTVRFNRIFTEMNVLPEVEALINNYRFRVTA